MMSFSTSLSRTLTFDPESLLGEHTVGVNSSEGRTQLSGHVNGEVGMKPLSYVFLTMAITIWPDSFVLVLGACK